MTPQELKEYINTNITTNGKGEISGEKMNELLNGIVDAIGQGGGLSVLRLNPNDEIKTDYERTGTGFSSLGTLLGITAEQARDLVLNNKYPILDVPVLLNTDGSQVGSGLTTAHTAVIWENTHCVAFVSILFPQVRGDNVEEDMSNIMFNNESLDIKYWEEDETWSVYFG